MALPFLVPLLVGGALLGANVARNKDENILEGALKGALLGGGASTLGGALGFGASAAAVPGAGITKAAATGGFSSAANPITGVLAQQTGSGGAAALKADLAAKASTATKSITPTFTPDAVTAIDAGRRSLLETAGVDSTLLREPLKYKGVTNIPGSKTFITDPTAIAQNNLGVFNPTITPPETFVAPNIFERAGTKLLATAKDKPLETAYFASTVGSALSPPPVTGGGAVAPFSPGSVQPTPTVDESIGEMPMFVPKPLFDDMMGRSPEEMMLLEEQMMQRGLV